MKYMCINFIHWFRCIDVYHVCWTKASGTIIKNFDEASLKTNLFAAKQTCILKCEARTHPHTSPTHTHLLFYMNVIISPFVIILNLNLLDSFSPDTVISLIALALGQNLIKFNFTEINSAFVPRFWRRREEPEHRKCVKERLNGTFFRYSSSLFSNQWVGTCNCTKVALNVNRVKSGFS